MPYEFLTFIALVIGIPAGFFTIIKFHSDLKKDITKLEVEFTKEITELKIETKTGFEKLNSKLDILYERQEHTKKELADTNNKLILLESEFKDINKELIKKAFESTTNGDSVVNEQSQLELH